MPGVLAGGRPGVRVGLPGADRRCPVSPAVRPRPLCLVAVGVVAVRRVLRRLPGQDRDPVAARASAGPGDPRAEVVAVARGAGHEDGRGGLLVAVAVRAGAEAGAARARAAGEGGAAGVERDARAPRAAEADVPGLVA